MTMQLPQKKSALLRILQATTTLPAQLTFYASALGAIALAAGGNLPTGLATLAGGIGVNALSSLLERVALGDEVSNSEILEQVKTAIEESHIAEKLAIQDIQVMIASLFRQYDLLSLAVQNHEYILLQRLTEQAQTYEVFVAELHNEISTLYALSSSIYWELQASQQQNDDILMAVQGLRAQLALLHGGTEGATSEDVNQYILDFSALIADRTEHFTGREFLFETLHQFIKKEPSGYLIIRGDPGIGKTSFVAQLVKTRNIVHHFNIIQQNISSSDQFLKNVCAQLISRYKLSNFRIEDKPWQDSTFFVDCLEAASAASENRPLIVAVDALDEAEWRSLSPRVNVHYLPPDLPGGVYIVLSARPDKRIPLEVMRRMDFDLTQDLPANRLDVARYLENYAGRTYMHTILKKLGISKSTFIDEMTTKSQGNFMYLHHVLPSFEEGKVVRGGINELPEGLMGYYRSHWTAMQEEIGGKFAETHEKVICTFVVINEPIPLNSVAEYTGLSFREVKDICDAWQQFLSPHRKGSEIYYGIYHASFVDFLKEQVDLPSYGEFLGRVLKEKAKSG